MKKIAILSIVLVTIALALFAQPGPPPRPGAAPAGPPPGPSLAEYLGLTDSQKAAWEAARTELEAATRPLMEKQRDLQEQLHQSTSNDPAVLGNLVLQSRAIGDQLKAAHDAFEQKQESTLTADQKTKYEAFEAALAFLRQHDGPPRGR